MDKKRSDGQASAGGSAITIATFRIDRPLMIRIRTSSTLRGECRRWTNKSNRLMEGRSDRALLGQPALRAMLISLHREAVRCGHEGIAQDPHTSRMRGGSVRTNLHAHPPPARRPRHGRAAVHRKATRSQGPAVQVNIPAERGACASPSQLEDILGAMTSW